MNDAGKPVTGPFEKTKGWLDWFDGPSKPRFALPPGTVDAHCHVFGPGAEFPYAPERKYTPCDASKAQLFALRDHLGFARNVIVQATCHGADNSAMVDACSASEGRARGIATVRRDVTDAELKALHEAGVRGVRFNFVKRLVDFTPKDELMEIAGRIAELGWHVVVYFEAPDLPELWDFFTALPTTVVVDHMGRPDVTKPVDGPEFARFLKFMRRVRKRLGQGDRRRAPVGLRSAGAERRAQPLSRRRAVRAQGGRGISRTGCCGERTGRIPTSRTTCPTTASGRHHPPYRARRPTCSELLMVDNPMRLYWPEEKGS